MYYVITENPTQEEIENVNLLLHFLKLKISNYNNDIYCDLFIKSKNKEESFKLINFIDLSLNEFNKTGKITNYTFNDSFHIMKLYTRIIISGAYISYKKDIHSHNKHLAKIAYLKKYPNYIQKNIIINWRELDNVL